MTATIAGFGGFRLALGAGFVWFRAMHRVRLPTNRGAFLAAFWSLGTAHAIASSFALSPQIATRPNFGGRLRKEAFPLCLQSCGIPKSCSLS